jgi:hypothetical protein
MCYIYHMLQEPNLISDKLLITKNQTKIQGIQIKSERVNFVNRK